jgi:hypothetical protein
MYFTSIKLFWYIFVRICKFLHIFKDANKYVKLCNFLRSRSASLNLFKKIKGGGFRILTGGSMEVNSAH